MRRSSINCEPEITSGILPSRLVPPPCDVPQPWQSYCWRRPPTLRLSATSHSVGRAVYITLETSTAPTLIFHVSFLRPRNQHPLMFYPRHIGICRLSNGNFLTDIVTCVKSNCDYQLDSNLFITPLQLACSLAGTPISSAAIRNAEFVETFGGYGAQTTTTTTTTNAASQGISTRTVTAAPAIRTSTLISTTTDSQGNTFYILIPTTVQQGSSTSTLTSGVTTTTVLAGAVASSASMSSQNTASVASSTSTSTTTVIPTSTTNPTTSSSPTNAAANSPAPSTNGSPFDMQSAGTRKEGSSWLGLMVGLIAGVVWF